MMGIAYKSFAFLIAWKVLSSGGGSGAQAHIDVLERFLAVVHPKSIKAVVADRELISADWLAHLQQRGIPFAIRMYSNRGVGDSEEGDSEEKERSEDGSVLPIRIFKQTVVLGTEEVLEDRYLLGEDGTRVKANVVVRRIASDESEDPFLILATWNLDPTSASALYRTRWEIETLFAALKSRVYDLEAAHLTTSDHIQRLIGLLALTFAWTHLVGEHRAGREGPPPTKRHGRREQSLFRYGLDELQSVLTTPEEQARPSSV